MTPSTCFLCAAIAITERRPVPQRAMNAAGGHKLAPGDSSAYQGFRRRYLRLLGDDGKFAPVPRWTRNEVRRDHRGVLQDQFYAKTLGARQSRRATRRPRRLTGAVLSLLLAVALEAPPDTCPLSPSACSSRCQSSFRRGKTRTSSTAWGVHWMLEPFGWSVRCAVWMRSRPLPYLPEDVQ